jgi:ribosomal protein S18 acetylase RimI-like enzyme
VSTGDEIAIRVARGSEAARAAEAFLRMPAIPARRDESPGRTRPAVAHTVVAVRAGEIVGVCGWAPGAGRCATVVAPRLAEWDEEVASRLIRGAASAAAEAGARFIQAVAEPEGRSPLARAIGRAGMERLAVLAYLRRAVTAAEACAPAPKEITWRRWTPWRRRQFARTIERTYEGSLDCPAMAGLRTAQDALATHRATGVFRAWAWHLALEGGEAVGVVLASEVEGRGDLVYLGVVPEARGRGIGRALLAQAIRDTARMGLPALAVAVDTANVPAVRLYAGARFKEVRRRLVFFVPRERLAALGGAPDDDAPRKRGG